MRNDRVKEFADEGKDLTVEKEREELEALALESGDASIDFQPKTRAELQAAVEEQRQKKVENQREQTNRLRSTREIDRLDEEEEENRERLRDMKDLMEDMTEEYDQAYNDFTSTCNDARETSESLRDFFAKILQELDEKEEEIKQRIEKLEKTPLILKDGQKIQKRDDGRFYAINPDGSFGNPLTGAAAIEAGKLYDERQREIGDQYKMAADLVKQRGEILNYTKKLDDFDRRRDDLERRAKDEKWDTERLKAEQSALEREKQKLLSEVPDAYKNAVLRHLEKNKADVGVTPVSTDQLTKKYSIDLKTEAGDDLFDTMADEGASFASYSGKDGQGIQYHQGSLKQIYTNAANPSVIEQDNYLKGAPDPKAQTTQAPQPFV